MPTPNAELRAKRPLAPWITAWVAGLLAGFAMLESYRLRPGTNSTVEASWPDGVTGLTRSDDRPTLVLFAHPECPCTRATIENLDRLLVTFGHAIASRVVFVTYASTDATWIEGPLIDRARSLPDSAVTFDPGGILARRFGAETSGDVLLYAADGRLLFQGGITDGRGHAGDCPGTAAILTILRGQGSPIERTPVFGCPLRDGDDS